MFGPLWQGFGALLLLLMLLMPDDAKRGNRSAAVWT